MSENIMRENLLYLEAWMSYNPLLKENLSIEGNILIYKNQNEIKKVDISNFYLPNMLYNANFRKNVALEQELTSKELFDIIKMYVDTETILEEEQKEMQLYPKIHEMKVLKDKDNKEFIALIDEFGNKYRYDTANPEKVINFYTEMREKNGNVTLKELGSVLESVN